MNKTERVLDVLTRRTARLKDKAVKPIELDSFEEGKHPRAANGQFGSGSGGSGGGGGSKQGSSKSTAAASGGGKKESENSGGSGLSEQNFHSQLAKGSRDDLETHALETGIASERAMKGMSTEQLRNKIKSSWSKKQIESLPPDQDIFNWSM